jgi:hypothetical protein
MSTGMRSNLAIARYFLRPGMHRCSNGLGPRQCETLNKWEIVGLFPSPELATAVANARAARTRLIEVLYDGAKMMGQEIIAELGATRKE